MSGEGITLREFARRDGCDEKVVRKALQVGHLVALADGKLDPALVGTGWRRGNRTNEIETVTKAEAERRKEVALAELREMEVDRERGLVVPVDEVAAMVAAEYAIVRTRLLAIPSKVALRAVASKTPEEAQAIIAAEIHDALAELSSK